MTIRPDTEASLAAEGRTPRWVALLDPSERVLGTMLLAPAAVLLALIIVYPVSRLVWTSFQDLSLTSGLPSQFIGFENFRLIWDDPVFWQTFRNTLIITVVTVPGALVAGLALALMANMPFRHKWVVRLSLLIPWALPLAFAGLIFAWFFHSEYGIVNDVLRRFGVAKVIWFNSPGWALAAICLTIVWKTSSFMALIILAGLQTIPRSLYEAADVDGAGRVRQFFEITLPLLKPAIVVALIFRTITALQTFDIPYTMTGGGPGTSTTTLAMYIHQSTVSFLDLGYGSALAVVMFALSMCVTVLYLRMIRAKGDAMTTLAPRPSLLSGTPLRLIVAAILLVNGLFPALWILFTSLKTEPELTRTPITWLPAEPTLQNYVQAFTDQPLHLFLFNSFMVATLSTALTLLVSTLAGYALARLNLRFRDLILAAIIAVSTFPLVTLLVPLFEIMRALGLLNSWTALVLPYTVLSLPICTLILVAFFEGIPRDLENSAMIDGCTRLGALFKVVVPLAAPGVFTAGILAFVNAWDEFLLALSFNSSPAMRTLPVGITLYQGEFAFPWPVISAALVVGIVPVAVLIVIFQERVVSGLTSGGIKG